MSIVYKMFNKYYKDKNTFFSVGKYLNYLVRILEYFKEDNESVPLLLRPEFN